MEFIDARRIDDSSDMLMRYESGKAKAARISKIIKTAKISTRVNPFGLCIGNWVAMILATALIWFTWERSIYFFVNSLSQP